MRTLLLTLAVLVVSQGMRVSIPTVQAQAEKRLKLLFLGDKGHHAPADRFAQLAPALKKRGIDLVYTGDMGDINSANFAKYDGLVVYANTTKISAEQEKALLDYVEGGKGFVPLHCASYCFLNSPKYIALVGAQFRSHGAGVFKTTRADVKHPILDGYEPFSSWDETYVHTKHNEKDRTVLEYRVDGNVKEPWTWVRTQGRGRVFYTAWGHDARTWGQAGFLNLVERGIRWACNDDPTKAGAMIATGPPAMTKIAKDAPPFEFAEAKVPFYPPSKKWGVMGKAINKMQKPLPAEASMKHMVTPVDFTVKLFADEKMLGGKPICMNWDERGRLWVGITLDYPNEKQPEGKGRDRIVILEDTDHDGVADKVTTFAEKLSIPTSIAFHKGGVIVHQAPHTLYMTEKDSKEAERKILFTGWSYRDTHAGPSNLWYGLDNWMHGMVGYEPYRGTVGGERHSFRQGFFRFKADGSKMEFLRGTNNNSWGVGFSEEGIHFGSTANGNPSEYMPIANRYYENVRGWSSSALKGIAGNARMHPITENVRQVDWHGGFTAAAGHSLYTARTYPREYWNRTAFVTEPTGHLAATFVLEREGADFRSRNGWNLLASQDEWTSPIMAEVGPDGHMWVIDWYNYIVQHNPTPIGYKTGKGNAYETELRDKKHGRIYRIVYTKAEKSKPLDLSKADAKTLVETLKHDNMRWRLHAQRLLVERGDKGAVPELIKLVKDNGVDEIGLNAGATHALWTLHGLGALDGGDKDALSGAVSALKHPSAGVRRNAALVLPATSVEALVSSGAASDADAQVRMAALLALAEMQPSKSAGKFLASQLKSAEVMNDRWLPDALTAAVAKQDAGFLSNLPVASNSGLSAKALEIVSIAARHYAMGRPKDSIDEVLVSLSKTSDRRLAEAVLVGLSEGWRRDTKVTLKPDTEKAVVTRLPSLSATGKASLIRLMGALGSQAMEKHAAEVIKGLVATLEQADAPDADRAEAAKQVVELQPEDATVVTKLLDAVTFQTPPVVVVGFLDAVGSSRAKEVGPELIRRMAGWTPATKSKAISVLLSRATTTAALLDAVEKGTLKMSALALDQKQALAAHPDKTIAGRAKTLLEKGGDLPSPDRVKVVEKYLPLAKKSGDVAKGKLVFEKHCAKCHKHSGKGEEIGPDLTGMFTHPREEMVVNVMDPSRSVEGNFRLYTVTTSDGKVFTGMLASETKTSVEIIDAEAKRTTVAREKIEDITQSEKSLMPDGFEKQVNEAEFIDLLEFMAQKSKYLPLALDKVATAVSTQGMFYSTDAVAERIIFSDWKPKTFEGVPFTLVDPKGDKVKNAVLLHSRLGKVAASMPKSVSLPVNTEVKTIHVLGGIGGWAAPYSDRRTVSMIVRVHYKDGKTEDHELRNAEHIADYIKRADVPGSKFAFAARAQQVRYLAVSPKREETVAKIELVKGPDDTAPIVMALTVETR